jgi:hypothetical protein
MRVTTRGRGCPVAGLPGKLAGPLAGEDFRFHPIFDHSRQAPASDYAMLRAVSMAAMPGLDLVRRKSKADLGVASIVCATCSGKRISGRYSRIP